MNKSIYLFVAPLLFTLCQGSLSMAEEHTVLQLGKSFVKPLKDEEIESMKNPRGKYVRSKVKKQILREIKIKAGDTINFINKDNVEHNVFGKGFDFHQKQGSKNSQKFTEKGQRSIRCAIHPKMKLKVIVE